MVVLVTRIPGCAFSLSQFSTGVSVLCPRMLNAPVVLYLVYLVVQEEEVLARAGLAAKNGIAHGTSANLVGLFYCWYYCIFQAKMI